jgi:putative oxygen-independent coproporphyrinogen III oxidase
MSSPDSARLVTGAGTDAARGLGIYVHWPFCAAICPYCDFNVYRDRGRDQSGLFDAILGDLAYWRAHTGPRALTSLYLGGGTPSLLRTDQVGALIDACARLWGFGPDPEITLEANPTDAEAARFAGFARAGVNRLSLGVQALDDGALKALGRFHSAEEARKAARLARRLFSRLSIDLIHSRPDQTLDAWRSELGDALALEPDHLSPYQLTIEPGTAFARAAGRGRLSVPAPDLAADFHELTDNVLAEAGFEAYEVSNHARSRDTRARHNLLYWTSQDWIGVGPGAHGRLGAGSARMATETHLRPQAYVADVASRGTGATLVETLGIEAAREEYWLMGLRLRDGVRPDTAPAGLDTARLAEAIGDGLAWSDDGRVGLSARGRMVANTLIAHLLGV